VAGLAARPPSLGAKRGLEQAVIRLPPSRQALPAVGASRWMPIRYTRADFAQFWRLAAAPKPWVSGRSQQTTMCVRVRIFCLDFETFLGLTRICTQRATKDASLLLIGRSLADIGRSI